MNSHTLNPAHHRFWRCLSFALWGLAFVAGCSKETPPTPEKSTGAATPVADRGSAAPASANASRLDSIPTTPAPKINVILYLIDTLRADRMSLYGHDRPTTPAIDALSAECVVFDNAHAPAPWTLPSVPSIMTSTFPCEHGVIVDGNRVPRDMLTLPDLLRHVGYYAIQFYANGYAGPTSDLSRCFDVSTRAPVVQTRHLDQFQKDRPTDKPFFLYIHTVEPHQPTKAPTPLVNEMGGVKDNARKRLASLLVRYRSLVRANWAENKELGSDDNSAQQDEVLQTLGRQVDNLRVLYDAAVRLGDQRLDQVVKRLRADGVFDNSVFILIADHGEEMSEHGAYLHSQSVYQELAHVPLMIRFPGGQFGGQRFSENVTLIDLLPTIADFLGRPDLAVEARGESLMPLIRGERTPRDDQMRVLTVRINAKRYYKPWAETRGNVNVAMRKGTWKGIYNVELDRLELYDLKSDPQEQKNLAAEPAHAALTKEFYDFGKAFYADCAAHRHDAGKEGLEGLDQQQLRDLAALGYIDLPGQASPEQEEEEESPASQPHSRPAKNKSKSPD